MHTVGLSWQHSFEVAAIVATAGGAGALAKDTRVRAAAAFVREVAVIGALYGLWQLAGKLSLHDTGDAYGRARWIERAQNNLLLSQHGVQHLILGHKLIVQTANLYYATMHFTMMFVFLLWLFWRHRDRYRPVRQVMAWTTLGCLLIQLVPVAPPRMLPGYTDTAELYGQSVYSAGIVTDQLSAMPSVHVAWCVIVGYYTWRIADSRWRFLGPLHAAITIFVVAATANHWWLDGIVATGVLVVAAWSVKGVSIAWRVLRARYAATVLVSEPEFDPTGFDPTAPDSSVLPNSAAQTP
ncbi:MAG TPA: phosphatase PAP2 family protein [Jatrophihabitans sp.]|jgi:hypothetical protein